MLVDQILAFFTKGLLEGMVLTLVFALLFRYLAYRHSRIDHLFFSTFSREVEKKIQRDRAEGVSPKQVSEYISGLLDSIQSNLPKRRMRSSKREEGSTSYRGKTSVSLRDYSTGDRSLLSGIRDEISSFESQFPPNFNELTARLMGRDVRWTTLFGFMPIDRFSRVLDILPGIFIVLGIFGTFVGISQALPEIAKINPNELEGASAVISQFVLKVTYAMDTSILGIIGSLILTLVNALFPITETRRNVFRRVANSLEHLWHFLKAAPADDQMQELLPILVKSVENIEKISEVRFEHFKKTA